jgi:hypothetical protein
MHSFGPYILPSLVASNHYKWVLLCPNEGCLSGLFYEDVNSGRTIKRLGAISDGTTARAASLRPQYHNFDFPSPLIGSPNAGLFLSYAVFTDLKSVDVCHVNQRCTGMLISYADGLTSVLGQWHTSYASQHSCIFHGSGPDITEVYFRISKSGHRQIVTNVSFSHPVATPTCDYRVFSIKEVCFQASSHMYIY